METGSKGLGRLAFGACDNLHRDCTVAFDPLLVPLLDALRAKGIIRSYTAQSDA